MNNYRDVLSGSDLKMPSGSEVEAATIHAPTSPVSSVTVVMPERSAMKENMSEVREKLDSLRTQGRMKLHDMQHTLGEKSAVMKSTMQRSMSTAMTTMQQSMTTAKSTMQRSLDRANTSVHTGLNDVQADMKVNPMKWAGIAAGSGFAIGLIGRFMHWRNKHQHHHTGMPQLVIIERAC